MHVRPYARKARGGNLPHHLPPLLPAARRDREERDASVMDASSTLSTTHDPLPPLLPPEQVALLITDFGEDQGTPAARAIALTRQRALLCQYLAQVRAHPDPTHARARQLLDIGLAMAGFHAPAAQLALFPVLLELVGAILSRSPMRERRRQEAEAFSQVLATGSAILEQMSSKLPAFRRHILPVGR
jgi:hypothetical protein